MKKTIKAWAIIGDKNNLMHWGAQYEADQIETFRTFNDAELVKVKWKRSGYSTKVVPCLITYELPKKSI